MPCKEHVTAIGDRAQRISSRTVNSERACDGLRIDDDLVEREVSSHREHDTDVSCQPGALVTALTGLLLPSADVTKRCQFSASTGALNTMCEPSDVQHSDKGTGSPNVDT